MPPAGYEIKCRFKAQSPSFKYSLNKSFFVGLTFFKSLSPILKKQIQVEIDTN